MARARVLFMIPDLRNPANKGGIQVFNNYVVRALEELEVDTTIIGVNDRPEDSIPGLITCNRGGRVRKIIAASHLYRELVLNRPDIVLCGHLNFSSLCRQACRMACVPYITITHGMELWDASQKAVRGAAASHRVLAVSRYTRSLNLELLEGYPEHVKVFHNTFDEERFRPAPPDAGLRSRLGIGPNDRVVLTVGRLASTERLKGYDEGILAMAKVCERMPEARYVLAGKGDDMDRLAGLARDCGLGDRLIMPGFISEDEIVPLFYSSDLFIRPCRKEGFGFVFLDSMGCGKPVIRGNRDGSMDPLCDGQLGTAVDPENVDELADAILMHLHGARRVIKPQASAFEVVDRFGFDRFRRRLEVLELG